MKVGFIGVGYMGYGIAKNLIKHGHKLIVVANKNRIPIDKIVYDVKLGRIIARYRERYKKNKLP